MQEFDLTNSPLDGNNLIEAGAGTGKTFTISGIYLRLLLEKALGVEDILVVTFTIAATEELRDRIRSRISTALHYFNAPGSGNAEDNLLCALQEKIEPGQAVQRLRTALQNFDQARIFTIHGFCHRLLTDHAFECSHPFEQEFIADQSSLIRELVRDFWRTRIQQQSTLFASYAKKEKLNEDNLLQLTFNWIKHPSINVLPRAKEIDTGKLEEEFATSFEQAKNSWQNEKGVILDKLCNNPDIKKNKNHEHWWKEIDTYLEKDIASLNYPEKLPNFSTNKLLPGEDVKKDGTPPEHEFFELAGELMETADKLQELYRQRIISLKSELLNKVGEELPKRKEKLGVISFDDLLSKTYSALSDTAKNPLLQTARQSYRAGLIDEFQDTDPIQRRIFTTIFNDNRPLFLIGDPKQAIYGFRGADIYAYLEAKEHTNRQYTLKTNWRSEDGLLRAINRVFSSERPFVLDQIDYQELSAPEREQDRIILQDEAAGGLVIWNTDTCPGKEENKPLSRGAAEEHLALATAREISRILQLSDRGDAYLQSTEGEEKIKPQHFAVLVRTHRQANLVHRELKNAGIPGVMSKSGNLFDSEEAREIRYILAALENPEHTPSLCSALSTSLLGFTANDIYNLSIYQEHFLHWVGQMHRYQRIWQEKGIMAALAGLIRELQVRPRVLAQEEGQRRMTNLGHLAEVLHRQEKEEHLSSRELLLWLDRNLQTQQGRPEEYELRLETDENAATLLTIHRSKGLQFPIVFAPFLFAGTSDSLPAVFHDPQNREELSLDLGSDFADRHLELGQREQLAENLRLFYVALSRAKHLCYTAWGLIKDTQTSAPFYLWHAYKAKPGEELAECKKSWKTFSTEQVKTDLDQLAAECPFISIRDMPAQPLSPWQGEEISGLSRENLQIHRSLHTKRRLSSFTYLIRGTGEEQKSLDEIDSGSRQEVTAEMSRFPGGIKAGNLLHALMERADFSQTDPGAHLELVANLLQSFRFHPEWEDTLSRLLSELLQTPLLTNPEIVLSDVPSEQRIQELEFYVPLSRITPAELQRFYSQQTGQEINRKFADKLGRLAFSPHQGFLRGFIDLVFLYKGKYYLVDWKSNYLGPSPEDYAQDKLESEMLRDFYLLQSHLYSLALFEHLQQRLPDFDYDRHFGGLFYVFVRGVDKDTPGQGIFFQQPSRGFLQSLEEFLI